MITDQGFQGKRLPAIVAELESSFRSEFGDNIDLRGNAPSWSNHRNTCRARNGTVGIGTGHLQFSISQ